MANNEEKIHQLADPKLIQMLEKADKGASG